MQAHLTTGSNDSDAGYLLASGQVYKEKRCNKHEFCNENFEFSDQSHIILHLVQPISQFSGD